MTLQYQVFRIVSKGRQCVRTLLVKVEVTVVSKNTMMITRAKVLMLNININSEHNLKTEHN